MTATVQQFMTPIPYTIGHRQSLAKAHQLMRLHQVRHLPVLDGGRLVGIVSDRDLHFIETLRDVDPEHVEVSEAMTQEVYTTHRHAAVRDVARQMAVHKYGAAVILDGVDVVGVFTTIDALRVLSDLLEERQTADSAE